MGRDCCGQDFSLRQLRKFAALAFSQQPDMLRRPHNDQYESDQSAERLIFVTPVKTGVHLIGNFVE